MTSIKFCPNCKSERIVRVGCYNELWECLDCGNQSAIFPEKELKIKSKTNKK
jgi:ribosomal protein L37AE/L43A